MRTPGMHDGTPHACTTKWTPPMQTLAPDPARDGGSITLLNSLPLDVGGWVWDLQADEPPIDHLEVHKTGPQLVIITIYGHMCYRSFRSPQNRSHA